MSSKFIERIIAVLTESGILPKLLVAIFIFIGAAILSKFFKVLLSRWQKTIISRISEKQPKSISSVQTRITITRKIITASIYFLATVFLLLQFDAVRNIGAGLLASAGIAGIIIGMSAQNTLSNVIAGISISFSQPVRLNDAVIFENDFGWIEEITLMHTIIKTWDNRRIVVPNNVLVNKVIQNWTIKDSSLLGVVMLYVDYRCDIEIIKKWVKEIVDSSPYSTEEKVAGVQVVDFTDKSMVLRILAKGADAPNTWNLRCEIREKLIKRFAEAGLPLPQIRIKTEKS